MSHIWIAFGSNEGSPLDQLTRARRTLAAKTDLTEEAASPIYRTPPFGYTAQADFYNAVVRYHTTLPPFAVLDVLQQIELAQHRKRTFRNGPRTLDLDLLLYDMQKLDTKRLTIPHPRLHERAFVLAPLADINPELMIVGHGQVATLVTQVDTSGQRVIDCITWPVTANLVLNEPY